MRTYSAGAPRASRGGARYLALDLGGGLSGGIVGCDAAGSLWLPYVRVPSVRLATERARRRGARVLLGPGLGPRGWRSVVATAAGAELALWQPEADPTT